MILQNGSTYSDPYTHLVSGKGFEPPAFSSDPALSVPASSVLQDKSNQFRFKQEKIIPSRQLLDESSFSKVFASIALHLVKETTLKSLGYLQRNIQEKIQGQSVSQTNIPSSLMSEDRNDANRTGVNHTASPF